MESGCFAWHLGSVAAITALAIFLGFLALLAICSKGYAWNVAAYVAIAFKGQTDAIYSRMPTVLSPLWWALAIISSGLVSAASVSRNAITLILALIFVGLTVAYTGVRAFRLMKIAAKEVGIAVPDTSSE